MVKHYVCLQPFLFYNAVSFAEVLKGTISTNKDLCKPQNLSDAKNSGSSSSNIYGIH